MVESVERTPSMATSPVASADFRSMRPAWRRGARGSPLAGFPLERRVGPDAITG
jgi:hypothetical protein